VWQLRDTIRAHSLLQAMGTEISFKPQLNWIIVSAETQNTRGKKKELKCD